MSRWWAEWWPVLMLWSAAVVGIVAAWVWAAGQVRRDDEEAAYWIARAHEERHPEVDRARELAELEELYSLDPDDPAG